MSPHFRQGRAEKEKAGQICPFPASAAAREVTRRQFPTRRHCSSTVAVIPEVVPLQFLEFRDCFINFGLCNVIFV